MRFTKYNNPNKKRVRKHISRTEADIIAIKSMLIDKSLGYDLPIETYKEQSDSICNQNKR